MAKKLWVGTDSGNEGDVNVAANWSPSGVPIAADDVWFDGGVSNQDVSGSLTALAAVSLGTVNIKDNFTGLIGTATTPLQLLTDDLQIGIPTGTKNANGSKRINLDMQSASGVTLEAIIYSTSNNSQDTGLPPVRLLTNDSNGAIRMNEGFVGLAVEDEAQTSTIDEITHNGGTFVMGSGVTIDEINVNGGRFLNNGSAVTTTIITGRGLYEVYNSPAHTSIDVRDSSAVCRYLSDGTITTLYLAGVFDTTKDPRPKTITNAVEAYPGARFLANTGNPGSVTLSAGIDLNRAKIGVGGVVVDLGSHINLTYSTLAL